MARREMCNVRGRRLYRILKYLCNILTQSKARSANEPGRDKRPNLKTIDDHQIGSLLLARVADHLGWCSCKIARLEALQKSNETFLFCRHGKNGAKGKMSRPVMGQYTRDQMEELAKNPDNIVMQETVPKTSTSEHKFRNEFLKMQVVRMRQLFDECMTDCPKYTELEVRTKVLNSKEGREYSWMILASQKKFIFDVVLKKFSEKEDAKKYDILLKCLELEDLRDKGFITTDKEIQEYWKGLGLLKEMNPVQHALDQIRK